MEQKQVLIVGDGIAARLLGRRLTQQGREVRWVLPPRFSGFSPFAGHLEQPQIPPLLEGDFLGVLPQEPYPTGLCLGCTYPELLQRIETPLVPEGASVSIDWKGNRLSVAGKEWESPEVYFSLPPDLLGDLLGSPPIPSEPWLFGFAEAPPASLASGHLEFGIQARVGHKDPWVEVQAEACAAGGVPRIQWASSETGTHDKEKLSKLVAAIHRELEKQLKAPLQPKKIGAVERGMSTFGEGIPENFRFLTTPSFDRKSPKSYLDRELQNYLEITLETL